MKPRIELCKTYSAFELRDEVEIIYSALQEETANKHLWKNHCRSLRDTQNTKRSFQEGKAKSKEKKIVIEKTT